MEKGNAPELRTTASLPQTTASEFCWPARCQLPAAIADQTQVGVRSFDALAFTTRLRVRCSAGREVAFEVLAASFP